MEEKANENTDIFNLFRMLNDVQHQIAITDAKITERTAQLDVEEKVDALKSYVKSKASGLGIKLEKVQHDYQRFQIISQKYENVLSEMKEDYIEESKLVHAKILDLEKEIDRVGTQIAINQRKKPEIIEEHKKKRQEAKEIFMATVHNRDGDAESIIKQVNEYAQIIRRRSISRI